MNIGDIIFTDKEYQWHDTNIEFHIVKKMTAFKIISLAHNRDEDYIRVYNIEEKYEVLMLKESYKDFFKIKTVRREKLKKIENDNAVSNMEPSS